MSPRRPFAFASLALSVLAGLASVSSAGDAPPPAGRVYLGSDVAALASLVEGLGYEPRIADSGDLISFDVTRTDARDETLGIEVRLLVSKGGVDTRPGTKLQLVVALGQWSRLLDAVPSAHLTALLKKSLELAPTRFWIVDAGKGRASVGLQRTLDNRDVRPIDVREQIDALFRDVGATRALWDESVWK